MRPVPLLPRIRSRATIRPELLEPKLQLREHWQFRIENNPFICPGHGGYSVRELFLAQILSRDLFQGRVRSSKKQSFGGRK